ncbi:beta-alanine transporter-like [Haemaphysalis longicornis]
MDHWCRRQEPFSNMSPAEWKALAIPVDPNGNYSRCTVREQPDGGTWARVVPCTEWEFDLSEYGENMVSAWKLVCERRWLKTLSVALHITTAMVVLPLAGALADRIGRKTVCFVSLTSLIMTLVASSFVANFLQYAITRSVALASASNQVILLVLLYEVTTPPRRLLYCTLAPSLGAVLELPFYFTVKLLRLNPLTSHLVLAVLALALVGSFYVLEESPLWLVAAHKEDEAELVVLRVAAVNGLSPSSGRALIKNFHLATHVMDHWCRRPEPFSNMSPAEWKALAIPVDSNGNYSRCTVREPPDGAT